MYLFLFSEKEKTKKLNNDLLFLEEKTLKNATASHVFPRTSLRKKLKWERQPRPSMLSNNQSSFLNVDSKD